MFLKNFWRVECSAYTPKGSFPISASSIKRIEANYLTYILPEIIRKSKVFG